MFLKNHVIRKALTIHFLMVNWVRCLFSRKKAHKIRREIIKKRGYSLVNKQVKRQIKKYCRRTFSSALYWPWLAVYTELRGSFIQGWLPVDYFNYRVIPYLNPGKTSYISLLKTLDYRILNDICVKSILIIVDKLIYNYDYELVTLEEAARVL